MWAFHTYSLQICISGNTALACKSHCFAVGETELTSRTRIVFQRQQSKQVCSWRTKLLTGMRARCRYVREQLKLMELHFIIIQLRIWASIDVSSLADSWRSIYMCIYITVGMQTDLAKFSSQPLKPFLALRSCGAFLPVCCAPCSNLPTNKVSPHPSLS